MYTGALGYILLASSAFVGHAFASQIVFSDLVQPGNQYGPDGLGVGHTPSFLPGQTGEIIGATGFMPSQEFQLTSIQIPIAYQAGFSPNGPNQADVSLVSDAGGLPGSAIESWVLTNLPATPLSPLTTISSVLSPILLPGHQYWVVVTGGPDTFDEWSFTQPGPVFGPFAIDSVFNGIDSGWSVNGSGRQGALAVSGNTIPEPSTLMLTILGLISVTLLLGRLPSRTRQTPRNLIE